MTKRDEAEEPVIARREVVVDAATMKKALASYSADRISEKGSPVRRAFPHGGRAYINVGTGTRAHQCYLVMPIEEFTGETTTYATPTGSSPEAHNEIRRNDPLGFYNGMVVSNGRKVLVGPPVYFRLAPEEPEAPVEEKPPEIPEEVMALAREKAGTRADVLDILEITQGTRFINRQFNPGYASLDEAQRYLDDFEECSERCTTGFHYAFDPRDETPRTYMVCSNPDCLKKKKAAYTRRVNAEGNARKVRERRGIREALKATTTLGHGRMKLILHAQLAGYHTRTMYYGRDNIKAPDTWLWDKVSPGIKAAQRTPEKFWKAVDKLSPEALAKLVVEFCFYALVDHGDTGRHQIKVEEQLKWLGVTLEEEKDEKAAEGADDAPPRRRRGKAAAAPAAEEETPVATDET